LHEFRLKQQTGEQLPNPRTLWIFELCVAKQRPLPRTKYSFVASTGRSIESHLRTHNISNKSSTLRNTRLAERGQQTTLEALGINLTDHQQQGLAGKLQALYDPQNTHLLLMEWIIMDNLPFYVVKLERFRRFLCRVDPEAWIPAENTVMNLVLREY
jgi:hypothetical protein